MKVIPKRLEFIYFYESEMGQFIYNRRRISIEPSLIEHIKSVFWNRPITRTWISARNCNFTLISFALSDNDIL
jgi:hypothetical protein